MSLTVALFIVLLSTQVFCADQGAIVPTLTFSAENDLWGKIDPSDQYFSNGLGIEYLGFDIDPWSLEQYALYSKPEFQYSISGFSIVHAMYTPINKSDTAIQYGDRPYTGHLLLGYLRKNTMKKGSCFRQINVNLYGGVVGEWSMADTIQNWWHQKGMGYVGMGSAPRVNGWPNQKKGALAVQSNTVFKKGYESKEWLCLSYHSITQWSEA